MASDTRTINLISSCTPASLSRAWCSTPHLTNPIIASCSSDKTVRIYSLTSFNLLSTIAGGHKRSIRTCAWKPGLKGESILATGSFDASVGIWRHDDEPLHQTEIDFTTGLAGGGSGGGGGGGGAEDDEDEEEEWRFALVLDGHDSEVKSVAWSAGGNLLATCARDKSVWVWEEVGTDDYETVAVLQEHTGDVKSVAWHPEEELLASGAYDDDVRLWRETADDWECVALLTGHAGTVWTVAWEPAALLPTSLATGMSTEQQAWRERRTAAGPRLASCSADGSVRLWRRVPRKAGATTPNPQPTLSIIRTDSHMEEWAVEAVLPPVHAGAIYSLAWSARTGLLASAGDDGCVAVYAERWADAAAAAADGNGGEDVSMAEAAESIPAVNGTADALAAATAPLAQTTWTLLALLEGAHDVYEVNHVAWARRADQARRQQSDADTDEEVLVTTGDDGAVKVWEVR